LFAVIPPMVAWAEVETSTGYHVDWIPKAEPPETGVQIVENDAGLDPCSRVFAVDLEQPIDVLAGIDDESGADGLAAL
jgi:hypothetical protein